VVWKVVTLSVEKKDDMVSGDWLPWFALGKASRITWKMVIKLVFLHVCNV